MQGPETERDVKLSFLLALCILFALIAAGLVSCCETNTKGKKHNTKTNYNYSKGDVVYLKPDSTIASISDTRIIIDNIGRYEANYKDNSGNLQTIVVDETQIYGKK